MMLSFDDFEMLKHPDKLLSIVGGAAVGGFGLGLLVQLLVRGWTGKQLPPKPLLLVPKAKMPLDPTVALVKV